jgi:hypothetical protein
LSFLDGDYSDYPEDLTQLIAPILENNIDFVVGSRVARFREKFDDATANFWNWLATTLMKIFFNATFTDLGLLELYK